MTEDKNKDQKARFLEYFRQLPVQKLAAASIGVCEDTIKDWKDKDSDFSDQIEMSKAEWAMKNVKGVRSKEWLLERLMNDHFADKKNIDLTSGGKPIPLLGGISNVPVDDSDQQTA